MEKWDGDGSGGGFGGGNPFNGSGSDDGPKIRPDRDESKVERYSESIERERGARSSELFGVSAIPGSPYYCTHCNKNVLSSEVKMWEREKPYCPTCGLIIG